MNWGSPNVDQIWDLDRTAKNGFTKDIGVVRRVWFGASYIGPPPASVNLRAWEHDESGDDLVYYMSVGAYDKLPQVVSLMELADNSRDAIQKLVRSRNRTVNSTIGGENEAINCFNNCFDLLLGLCVKLHLSHLGLGLIHPENILFISTQNGLEIVLPDWGFVHDEPNYGPKGLSNLMDPVWNTIRKEDISESNRRIIANDKEQVFADIQALGRILEATLLGKQEFLSGATVSRQSVDKIKSIQRRYESLPSYESCKDLRDTIRTAIDAPHEISKIQVLRDRLKNQHPSRYFEFQAECKQMHRIRRRNHLVRLLSLILILLSLGTGVLGVLYQNHVIDPWPPSPPEICPDCYGRTELKDLLVEFQGLHASLSSFQNQGLAKSDLLQTTINKEFQLLIKAHDPTLLSSRFTSRKESELNCLQILRNHYADDLGLYWQNLEKDWIEVKNRLDNLAGDSRSECDQLNGLLSKINELRSNYDKIKPLGSFESQPDPDWTNQFNNYLRDYCGQTR
jgi:hypothetical protein